MDDFGAIIPKSKALLEDFAFFRGPRICCFRNGSPNASVPIHPDHFLLCDASKINMEVIFRYPGEKVARLVTKGFLHFAPSGEFAAHEVGLGVEDKKRYYREFNRVLARDGKAYVLSDFSSKSMEDRLSAYAEDIEILKDLNRTPGFDLKAVQIQTDSWIGIVLEHSSGSEGQTD